MNTQEISTLLTMLERAIDTRITELYNKEPRTQLYADQEKVDNMRRANALIDLGFVVRALASTLDKTPMNPIPPLRGKELLLAVLTQITNHPETWNQNFWHCGTTHCVAGWCQIIGGININTDPIITSERATGLTLCESAWLFDSARTLPEITSFINNFTPTNPITI